MQVTLKAGLGLTILGLLAAAAIPALAGAPPVPAVQLYDTGVDAGGQVLSDGATGLAGDQHYTLITVPTGSTTDLRVRTSAGGFPIAPNGPYLGDNATSAWIGPNNQGDLHGVVGTYDYRTTFTLTAAQASAFLVTGNWATDNAGLDILINGQSTGNHIGSALGSYAGFEQYTPFQIGSGFQSGDNTLDFLVYNGSEGSNTDDNPTALRVDGIVGTTVAPEPSSFAVFGFLGLGMAGLMLKARKRSASAA
jgi:hypothetical protein